MNLVLNASPLIFFSKIGLIDLLPSMVDKFVIPKGVIFEIEQHNDEAAEWVKLFGKRFEVAIPAIPKLVAAWDLGLGETEVIAYAYNNKDYIVAIDDKAARNCAKSLQIGITGTIGLIVLAKRKQKIDAIEPHLKMLIDAGYRISRSLYEQALDLAKS
jgi:predicted nucleic acid-binding protein